MTTINLYRPELKTLLGSKKAMRRVRKLLELQGEKHSEVGGELYLLGKYMDSLFFRVVPSWFEHLIEYVKSDLIRGVYDPRLFSGLKESFQDEDDTDKLEIRHLLKEMMYFEVSEAKRLKDAKKISRTVLEILNRRYEKSMTGYLRVGAYIGDFHIHWNGRGPSKNDKPSPGDPPELVIIRDGFDKVRFSYLYRVGNNRVKRYNVGPYYLE